MGSIDITAVIASYNGNNDITTWDAFVKEITANTATAQSATTPFSATFRGVKAEDCAGTKYSLGLTNVSAFTFSESTIALNIAASAESISIFFHNCGLGAFTTKPYIATESHSAVTAESSGAHQETHGISSQT